MFYSEFLLIWCIPEHGKSILKDPFLFYTSFKKFCIVLQVFLTYFLVHEKLFASNSMTFFRKCASLQVFTYFALSILRSIILKSCYALF